jgi:DNA-binding NarL/FixJ family response regulator
MGDSLRTLLKAMPQVKIIGQVEAAPLALRMLATHRPALILFASNIPYDEVRNVLKQVKPKYPQIHCIVLADTVQQQQSAEAEGADEVLLAGFPAVTLFTTIEKLMPGYEMPAS